MDLYVSMLNPALYDCAFDVFLTNKVCSAGHISSSIVDVG